MQHLSFVVATSTSPTPPSTGTVSPTSQPSAVTITPSPTQSPIAEPSIKDYVPVPIFVVVVAGLITIVGTLLWKWHEAEVKRIEAEKDAEVKAKDAEIKRINIEKTGEIELLDEQKKREISERDTKILILEAEVKNLKEEKKTLEEIRSILPLQYLKETKPALEIIINDLREKIKLLNQEKDNISLDRERLKLELEGKLATFESNLHKLSILEKHLAERAANIRQVSTWLEHSQTRLAEEACHASLQCLNAQDENTEQKKTEFINDVNDFLMIIGKCLDLGRTNLLDKAMTEITPVIDPQFYAKAFIIIRDEKVPLELSNDNVRREIEIYLSYLIEKLRSSSS